MTGTRAVPASDRSGGRTAAARTGPGGPAEPASSAPGAAPGLRDRGRPRSLAVLIGAVGGVLTSVSVWATDRVDGNAEHRLLQRQTSQAAAVLSTAILGIQQPLTMALTVQRYAAPGGTSHFPDSMATYVGPGRTFVAASLWKRQGDVVTRVSSTGASAATEAQDSAVRAFVAQTFDTSKTKVRAITRGDRMLIGYGQADPSSGYAVYAERAIPADRRSPVDRDSAFADLHYATYLGPKTDLASLATTDVRESSLPLSGDVATATVPFGDTVLTLVASPKHHLGSPLGQWLPLILLAAGLLLTAIAAWIAQRTVRGWEAAEKDARTITDLYRQVEASYGQQRVLYERLQRALLPHVNPTFPDVTIASEYVAGAQGADIGGDWFSVIGLDDDSFGFVVGDVSGRGIDAVAVMAHARFTLRAYLVDGDAPEVALEKCSHQFDISVDGHMTTALVGSCNWRTGEVTLASAGHPPPLVLDGSSTRFADTPVGPPLGTGPSRYRSATVRLPPGALLFTYTDGLVERRTEDIDTGLGRLAATLREVPETPVDEVVRHTLQALRHHDAADDIAVLAFRWREATTREVVGHGV